MTATATQQLGRFLHSTAYADLPAAVIDRTKVSLLDSLGCSIAGANSRTSKQALLLAEQWARPNGRATFFFSDRMAGSLADVSFVNAVFAHAILHEDVGQGGHPACNVVPAAIAGYEATGATGRDLLLAIALGYEVQVRIGAGNLLHVIGDRGLRGTTTSGAFGAAAATASLLGLSESEAASAIGFCASMGTPGIEEPLIVGSDERCLHMGANTRAGVTSAEMALAGYTSALSALDGSAGFYRAYGLDEDIPHDVLRGLGSEWHSASGLLVFKPYPSAGWNVGPIYSAELIAADPRFDAEQIRSIDVLHTWWHRNTGYIYPGPFRTIEQALVSCNFAIATTLIYGRYDWETVQAAFNDQRVGELATKVNVEGVATWGFIDGAVRVELDDGTELSASADEMPPELTQPDWNASITKFIRLTAGALSEEEAMTVIDWVHGLPTSENEPLPPVLLARLSAGPNERQ